MAAISAQIRGGVFDGRQQGVIHAQTCPYAAGEFGERMANGHDGRFFLDEDGCCGGNAPAGGKRPSSARRRP